MLARLDQIEADLTSRRKRAECEGWHGETEGLDLTLSFLRAKRANTQRFTRKAHLGSPPSARSDREPAPASRPGRPSLKGERRDGLAVPASAASCR